MKVSNKNQTALEKTKVVLNCPRDEPGDKAITCTLFLKYNLALANSEKTIRIAQILAFGQNPICF